MMLRDYYVEKAAGDSGPDNWALRYINIGRAHRIMEAVNADASGFVTVNEVNNFTQSRPLDWRFAYSLRDTRIIHSHRP
jgi:hypothetical protein